MATKKSGYKKVAIYRKVAISYFFVLLSQDTRTEFPQFEFLSWN